MLRVILFAPIHTSLYSRLVLHGLLNDPSVEVVGVVVRDHRNVQRIRSEFRRDGKRLIRKFIRKYLLREKMYDGVVGENLAQMAQDMDLPKGSLRTMAEEASLPYLVCKDLSDEKCEQFLLQKQPDLIAFTGGGLIRKNILQIPTLGVLNCHTGVLPKYRGMDVVEWTALEGALDTTGFGVSLHYMDKGVDTGPIIKVISYAPSQDDTFSSIRMKLEVKMVTAMLSGIQAIAENRAIGQPQNLQDGRQYFVMHARMKMCASARLKEQLHSH